MFEKKELVQFVGLDELPIEEKKRVMDLVYENFEKISREIKKINSLKVTFKLHAKSDSARKGIEKSGGRVYSVHLFLDAPTKPIVVTRANAEDPTKALHIALEKLRKEIIHRYKISK